MIGQFIVKGIPKCSNCFYHRMNKDDNIMKCIKFLGSHNKPIDAEISRYSDLMCGYYGTHHKSGELLVVKKNDTEYFVMQPHI